MISAGWKWIERGTDLLWPASLEIVFAATLLLLIAAVTHLALRRAAASLRHRVWALTMGALLLLPLLCPILPKLPLPLSIPLAENTPTASRPAALTPERTSESAIALPPARIWTDSEVHPTPSALPAEGPPTAAGPLPRPPFALPVDVPAAAVDPRAAAPRAAKPPIGSSRSLVAKSHCALVLVWALGTVLYLLAMARWLWLERRMAKIAGPLDDPSWQALLEELKLQFGIRWAVALGVSQESEVPLAVGWRRPKILLPVDCRCWTAGKRRVVLAHELSHVARHDVFWQVVARLACAVYWFHPLAWLAERRMRVERELACDDAVLRSGSQPDQYAAVLLDVAAAISRRPPAGAAVIAMACRHPIQRRIRAILQPGLNRLPVGPRTGRLLLAAVLLLVVLAAGLHPFVPPVKADNPNTTVAASKASAIIATTKSKKPGETSKPATNDVNPEGSATPAAGLQSLINGASLPRRTHLFNDKYSAVGVQTEKDVSFVLVYRGFLSTGMEDWYTDKKAWGFDGNVYLVDEQKTRIARKNVDKRKFAVKYTSRAPETLFLDGKAYDLSRGRVFILRDEGEPVQTNRTLPLRNEKDLVTIGDFAESRARELQPKDKDAHAAAKAPSAVAAACEVKGKVIDENGKTLSGADVWLPVRPSGTGIPQTLHAKSDNQGQFVLEISADLLAKVKPWERELTVWAYARGRQLGAARAVLPNGASDVVLQLGPATNISFVVFKPEGQPCAGALVEIVYVRTPVGFEHLPDELMARVAASTDAEGRVKLPAASPDTLSEVRITAKDYGIQIQQIQLVENRQPRAIVGYTIRLRPVGKIEGRVISNRPEAARDVRLIFSAAPGSFAGDTDVYRSANSPQEPTEGFAEVKSDKDGRFVVPALAAGLLQVNVLVNESQPLRPKLPGIIDLSPGKTASLEIPLVPTVVVRGAVRWKDTGKPIPGAPAYISYGVGQGASAVTDAQGNYTARVLPGRVAVQMLFTPEEYVQYGARWKREVEVPQDAKTFDLPPAELVPARRIEGRLVDVYDRPIANARIFLSDGNRSFGYGDNSDSGGKFTLLGVPKTIDPAKAEYKWSGSDGVPHMCEVHKTDPLVLRAAGKQGAATSKKPGTPDGASKPSVDAAPAKVSGKVIDENGKPLAGADVWLPLFIPDSDRIETLRTKSDDQGRFVLEVRASWVAKLQQPPRMPLTLWAYAAGHQLGPGNVALSSSASNLTIRLGLPTDTSFVVSDPEGRPCASALVEPFYIRTGLGLQFLPDELLARAGARTDTEGRVRLPAAPPDLLYQVRVHAKGLGTQLQPTTPASAIVGSAIRLRPVGKIEGRVIGGPPQLVRSVELVFTSSKNDRPRPFPLKEWPIDGYAKVKSDEQGRFTVPAIALGDAWIEAHVDEKQPLRLKLPVSVNVPADRAISLEIPLVPSVVVRGSVRVKDTGKPVAGARIHIRFGVARQGAMAASDAQGNYTARVLPGRIGRQVIAMPEPYVPLSDIAARTEDDRSFEVPKDAKEFDLPPIEAGLAGPTKSIRGRVVDQQGQPVGGIRIFVVEGDRHYWGGKSDQRGRFEVAGVPVTVDSGKAKYDWLPEVGLAKPFVSTIPSKCEVLKTDPLLLHALPRDPRQDMP
jgi:beta-lactamase regulating signal transducer with metallopeptidase domain